MVNYNVVKIELDNPNLLSQLIEATRFDTNVRIYYRSRSSGSGEFTHGAMVHRKGAWEFTFRSEPFGEPTETFPVGVLSDWVDQLREDVGAKSFDFSKCPRNRNGHLSYYVQVKRPIGT